jgi:COP9 signalosome complex subunit 1
MDSVEPMQVDDPESAAAPPSDFTVEPPNFDLEGYANSYEGLAKVRRLLFVAKHCPSLQIDALRRALRTVELTHNMTQYTDIRRRLYQATSDAKFSLDQEECTTFIMSTNKRAAITLERLDADLKNYRHNVIKESIRRGYDALGDHHLDCGDLNNALKMYTRARDHCTSNKHVVQLCLNIIKVSIHLKNWQQVLNYYSKAEGTPEMSSQSSSATVNQEIACRLKCSAGLAELENRKYKNAARLFLQIHLDDCKCPDLLSPHTVALYGGLCALASFDRQDLYTRVIASSSFKQFLELDPLLRDVVTQFHQSSYASCLRTLEDMRSSLMLDMYLSQHLQTLLTMIRNKALIQYFSPFSSVDLHRMAAAFNTSVSSLEDELTQLILDGQISARIDSHAKVMYARQVDQRSAIFQKALEVGEAYQLRTKALLIRSLLQKHDIKVKDSKSHEDGDTTQTEATVKRARPRF